MGVWGVPVLGAIRRGEERGERREERGERREERGERREERGERREERGERREERGERREERGERREERGERREERGERREERGERRGERGEGRGERGEGRGERGEGRGERRGERWEGERMEDHLLWEEKLGRQLGRIMQWVSNRLNRLPRPYLQVIQTGHPLEVLGRKVMWRGVCGHSVWTSGASNIPGYRNRTPDGW